MLGCKAEERKKAEKAVRNIRRKTRKQYSAGEKIRIVLDGLRGEESIAVLCRPGLQRVLGSRGLQVCHPAQSQRGSPGKPAWFPMVRN